MRDDRPPELNRLPLQFKSATPDGKISPEIGLLMILREAQPLSKSCSEIEHSLWVSLVCAFLETLGGA